MVPKPMKLVLALWILIGSVIVAPAFAQDKVFDWLPANDESVQLDPADYHTARVYRPGDNGGNMHVDIDAQQPVTIEMAPNDEWNEALRRQQTHPDALSHVDFRCVRDHVVKATYVCSLPPDRPMVMIIRDERNPGRSAIAGIGALFGNKGARQFVSPNAVHVQYYSWSCVQNCVQPQFQWFSQVKEKYQLTPILKVYGGIEPDRDGERLSVTIKASIPMAVAVLPTAAVDQLYQNHDAFESVLANSSCKQRGIQSLSFECTLNASDGPQSLIVAPEPGTTVPHNKKTEIEVSETKCIENCNLPAGN